MLYLILANTHAFPATKQTLVPRGAAMGHVFFGSTVRGFGVPLEFMTRAVSVWWG